MCIGFIVNIYGRASPTVIMPPLCHVGQVLISAPSSAAFSSHVHSHKTPSQRGKQHVQYEETVVSTNYVWPKLSYKCTLIIWWLLSQTSWLRVRMVCKAILLCRSNLPALPFFCVCVCWCWQALYGIARILRLAKPRLHFFFIPVSLFYHRVK